MAAKGQEATSGCVIVDTPPLDSVVIASVIDIADLVVIPVKPSPELADPTWTMQYAVINDGTLPDPDSQQVLPPSVATSARRASLRVFSGMSS